MRRRDMDIWYPRRVVCEKPPMCYKRYQTGAYVNHDRQVLYSFEQRAYLSRGPWSILQSVLSLRSLNRFVFARRPIPASRSSQSSSQTARQPRRTAHRPCSAQPMPGMGKTTFVIAGAAAVIALILAAQLFFEEKRRLHQETQLLRRKATMKLQSELTSAQWTVIEPLLKDLGKHNETDQEKQEAIAEIFHEFQKGERIPRFQMKNSFPHINANFPCVRETNVIGVPTLEDPLLDGHKYACGLKSIAGPPIVYSIGSNGNQGKTSYCTDL
jgi:hypothetical protein